MADRKAWDEAIGKLFPDDREKYRKGIELLRGWSFFEQEFMATDIFAVSSLLEVDIEEVKV